MELLGLLRIAVVAITMLVSSLLMGRLVRASVRGFRLVGVGYTLVMLNLIVGSLFHATIVPEEWKQSFLPTIGFLTGSVGQTVGLVLIPLGIYRAMRSLLPRLTQSESLYENFVHSIDGIIYEVDARLFRFTFVSDKCEQLLGYERRQWMRKGAWEKIIHPDDLKHVLEYCAAAAKEKRNHTIEFRAVHANGRIVWLRDVATVIVEPDQSVKFRGVLFDITERKRTEQALGESEGRLRTIIKAAPQCIKLLAADGTILQMNPAGLAMIEAENEAAVVGHSPYPLVTPEHREAFRSLVEKVFRGESGWLTFQIVGLNGTLRWLDTHAVPLRNDRDEIIAMLGITEDITDRKRTEESNRRAVEALHEREAHFGRVIEQIFAVVPDAVMVLTERLNLYKQNKAFDTIVERYATKLGYAKEELAGRILQELKGKITGGERSEIRIPPKQTANPAMDELILDCDAARIVLAEKEEEEEASIVISLEDITERKRAERLQQAVYRIAQAADRFENVGGFFQTVHGIIGEVLPAKNFYIALYDEKNDLLSFPYFVDEEDVPTAPQKPGKGLTEYVLRTGKPLLCDPLLHEKMMQAGEANVVGAPSLIWLGVPLKVEAKTIGVMTLQHYTDPHAYGPREQEILEYVSSQVARVIHRKWTQEALARLAEQRNRLLEISRMILSTLDLDKVIDEILQALGNVLHYDTCGMYWVDDRAAVLRPHKLIGTEWISRDMNQWLIPMGKGVVSAVARSGKGELVNDAHLDPRSVYPEGATVTCEHLIAIPIRSREKIIGVFNVARKADPPFTREEFHLVELFLTHTSLAIENARLFEQTKESEMKYRTLFEESKDVVFMSTPDGRFLDINPVGLDMFGYATREELLTPDIALDLHWDASQRERVKEMMERQGYVKDLELELKRKDGRKLMVLETATAVRDKEGNIAAYRGFIRDVTAQKMLEEQFRQSQKIEGLGTLAAGIAHDFNNILSIILGHASILERTVEKPEKILFSVQAVTKAVNRGAGLVKQLLTFARKSEVLMESVRVNDVVEELIRMLGETFPKTITYSLDLKSQLPTIYADRSQLYQVLINLCVNARDAMPSGGTLSISTQTVHRADLLGRLPHASSETYICVRVTDTGEGMDRATLSRIFEPFFTTKELGKGTGLGLSVVYGVLQNHKGLVDVQSEVGRGTSFYLYFPVLQNHLESAGLRETEHPEAKGGTETILVVEDEELLLVSIQSLLESKGYTVLTAMDGEEAVERYKQAKDTIDMVLTDMGLPKLDGQGVFSQLKTLNPEVKVLFASGFLDPLIKTVLLEGGAMEFVQKPYMADEILMKIRSVIDR